MAIGIICEYNPFHKGHLYQLNQARGEILDTPIVCVMSGHYVQRAEPAIIDKWTRTRMALSAGASLVIELPTYYSTATAEWFALGSVRLLQATGLIDRISFGIEDPEQLPVLRQLAAHLTPESYAYQALLRRQLTQASSFAQARLQALQELTKAEDTEGLAANTEHALVNLQEPNTILVLEYLRALRKLGWSPALRPVQRVSASYHDSSVFAAFPSASAIRRQAAKGGSIQPYLPDCAAALVPDSYVFPQDLFAYLPYCLSFHTPASLREIPEVAEGLENRILAAARVYPDYDSLLSALKTKRYPTSRLRRILLNILLGITHARRQAIGFEEGPAYLRVLGFRRDQAQVLSQLTRSASLPVVTNLPRQLSALPPRTQAMLADEVRFSQIYGAAAAGSGLDRDMEYRQPLVII